MRKAIASAVLVAGLSLSSVSPAAAESSLSGAALTTVLAVAGAAAGVVLLPYALPAAAPAVAGGYGATATAVNSALGSLGAVIVAQPQVAGAIIGMGTGIIAGFYLFN